MNAALAHLLCATAATASVVINEVSDRGTLATCSGGDWVEIVNTGPVAWDLSGWKICDSDGCEDDDAVSLTGVINAGAYKVDKYVFIR